MSTHPASITPAVPPALLLLLVAVAGKWVGTIGPALLATGLGGATALGISMVPRAEITMIILNRGLQFGDWALTPTLFSAMVLVCAAP